MTIRLLDEHVDEVNYTVCGLAGARLSSAHAINNRDTKQGCSKPIEYSMSQVWYPLIEPRAHGTVVQQLRKGVDDGNSHVQHIPRLLPLLRGWVGASADETIEELRRNRIPKRGDRLML